LLEPAVAFIARSYKSSSRRLIRPNKGHQHTSRKKLKSMAADPTKAQVRVNANVLLLRLPPSAFPRPSHFEAQAWIQGRA